LLITFVYLSFGQQRIAFGRATGLVTVCEQGVGHGNLDRWSPLVLLLVAPLVIVTMVLAWRGYDRRDDGLQISALVVAGTLAIVTVALVLIPFGGWCVE
jgi:hypothetical protein